MSDLKQIGDLTVSLSTNDNLQTQVWQLLLCAKILRAEGGKFVQKNEFLSLRILSQLLINWQVLVNLKSQTQGLIHIYTYIRWT